MRVSFPSFCNIALENCIMGNFWKCQIEALVDPLLESDKYGKVDEADRTSLTLLVDMRTFLRRLENLIASSVPSLLIEHPSRSENP